MKLDKRLSLSYLVLLGFLTAMLFVSVLRLEPLIRVRTCTEIAEPRSMAEQLQTAVNTFRL